MSKLSVTCEMCGKVIERWPSEINRMPRVFCSRSCAAKAGNLPRRSKAIVVVCPCGKRINTTTHNKARKHCSRSCASRFSVSGERREAQSRAELNHKENLLSVSELLKIREGWKYSSLKEALRGRDYEFEFELGGKVFDLALLDAKVLVEFDGPDHSSPTIISEDTDKETIANAAGFVVIRRPVIPSTVVSPETIEGL